MCSGRSRQSRARSDRSRQSVRHEANSRRSRHYVRRDTRSGRRSLEELLKVEFRSRDGVDLFLPRPTPQSDMIDRVGANGHHSAAARWRSSAGVKARASSGGADSTDHQSEVVSRDDLCLEPEGEADTSAPRSGRFRSRGAKGDADISSPRSQAELVVFRWTRAQESGKAIPPNPVWPPSRPLVTNTVMGTPSIRRSAVHWPGCPSIHRRRSRPPGVGARELTGRSASRVDVSAGARRDVRQNSQDSRTVQRVFGGVRDSVIAENERSPPLH